MKEDARLDAVFGALADPTRRLVVRRLLAGAETATALAGDLPISRQAVVKHLQALAEAGLVAGVRAGREVRYRAEPGPLGDAAEWLVATGAAWDLRLARLRGRLEGRPRTR